MSNGAENTPNPGQESNNDPSLPKHLAAKVVPAGFLNDEVLAFLAARGIAVLPKPSPYVFLGTQRERFQLSSIFNMRPSEHKGHSALIFHYQEIADAETVAIIFEELNKDEVFLLEQAISSGRVQVVPFGELERYMAEYYYRVFLPFASAVVTNYPARLAAVEEEFNEYKRKRRVSIATTEPIQTSPSSTINRIDQTQGDPTSPSKTDWVRLIGAIGISILIFILVCGMIFSCWEILFERPAPDLLDQIMNKQSQGGTNEK